MEDSGVSGSQQPGKTIAPTSSAAAQASEPAGQAPASAAPAAPAAAEPAPKTAAAPPPSAANEEPVGGFFRPENGSASDGGGMSEDAPATPEAAGGDDQAITWTASEFIVHAKSPGWYLALAAGAAAFAALVYLVTKDFVSVGVILVAAAMLGVFAGRKPRQLQYRLDATGLNIGQRRLSYQSFRSFSVLPEGGISSIVFMPLKRFAVPTTIYYPPEEEEKIVSLLSDRLPLEKGGHDAIDRFLHRIRF